MDSVNDEEFARMELRLRDVARQRAELATEVARRGVLVRDVLVSMGTGRAAVAEAPPEVAPETVEVVPVDDAGIAQAAREHEARVASLEGEVRGLRFRADDAERVVAGLPSLRSQLADADEENRRLGELVASLRRQVAELDARAAEAALRIEEERSDAEAVAQQLAAQAEELVAVRAQLESRTQNGNRLEHENALLRDAHARVRAELAAQRRDSRRTLEDVRESLRAFAGTLPAADFVVAHASVTAVGLEAD